MNERLKQAILASARSVSRINETYLTPKAVSGVGMKHGIACFITLVRRAMYPVAYASEQTCESMDACFEAAGERLTELCRAVLGQEGKTPLGQTPEEVTEAFFARLPQVAELLRTDLEAAYQGDPAATSEEEILYAYPSFEAVSIYRMAHVLYELRVPMLPRMMTEHAHQNTGIDIHPGATVGSHFFIDHGTGVVVGETCIIGDRVKLYQGVTLGAKSFELDEEGNPVKGVKRHPRIGNRVVIYAGATILGGTTYVGDGAVIGGNVWLTHSVEPGTVVTNSGIKNAEK